MIQEFIYSIAQNMAHIAAHILERAIQLTRKVKYAMQLLNNFSDLDMRGIHLYDPIPDRGKLNLFHSASLLNTHKLRQHHPARSQSHAGVVRPQFPRIRSC